MKKIINLILPLSIFLVILGCEKEFIQPEPHAVNTEAFALKNNPDAPGCQEYFYTYYQDKISLGPVQTNQIVIGFEAGTSLNQKQAFILKYPFLDSIKTEYNTGSADATIVTLKNGRNCNEVLQMLEHLKEQKEVQYATPFFNQNGQLLGITNQFIVNLKETSTPADLENLIRKTGTTLVDQYSDFTFVLSADKYSDGNALEMANYFARQQKVETAEPDFLYDFEGL